MIRKKLRQFSAGAFRVLQITSHTASPKPAGCTMKSYATVEYTIELHHPAFCTGRSFTAAYFSDLHTCCDPYESREIEERLHALEPDLVLCGGDSITAIPGMPVKDTVRFLQRIAAQYPLVIGTGNHEYRARLYPDMYGSMYDSYKKPLLETENVYLLENAVQDFKAGDVPVKIYGFDLPRMYFHRLKRKKVPKEEISRVFGRPDEESVSILLSHNPAALKACLEWGADLTLFGHYHGGIMRFGSNRGLISPEFRPFPGNAYGHFQNGEKHGIISSGCGEHTVSVRIRNPREIVGIHIHITD